MRSDIRPTKQFLLHSIQYAQCLTILLVDNRPTLGLSGHGSRYGGGARPKPIDSALTTHFGIASNITLASVGVHPY